MGLQTSFAGLYFCLLQLGFVVSGPEARVWKVRVASRREMGLSSLSEVAGSRSGA